MKEELQIFFTAVSFYTRIPVPSLLPYKTAYSNQSTKYLPVIGWIVGAFSFCIFFLSGYIFNPPTAVLLSIAASILLTGAFHEDGFADVCDGFGGGYTKEKILEFMKDSRLGTYGVTGLILTLILKFLALQQLAGVAGNNPLILLLLLFVVPHTLSRFTAISLIYSYPYAGGLNNSKSKTATENPIKKNFWIAALLAIIPLAWLIISTNKPLLGVVIIPLYLQKILMGKYFSRKIGGYTGDCLGAVQQVAEILCYLTFIAIWKFS